jgi:hypothetical protein
MNFAALHKRQSADANALPSLSKSLLASTSLFSVSMNSFFVG